MVKAVDFSSDVGALIRSRQAIKELWKFIFLFQLSRKFFCDVKELKNVSEMFLFLLLIVLSLDTELKSAIDKSIEKVVNYFFEAQVLLKETN